MNLVDTHAHLYWDSYQPDLEAVFQRAKEAGIKLIINIGVDLESSRKSLQLSFNEIELYTTIGIHPHDGNPQSNDESIQRYISQLESLYQIYPNKIVAVGECGLDYNREHFKNAQMKLFLSQIELAKSLNLPLVIHCRDAWNDIFTPQLNGTRGVFHNFSGSLANAQQALRLGYYLSFSCVLTYPKNNELRELIKTIPLEKILTETDSPFLPPQQIRGERNEPAHIQEVVKVIAESKNLPMDQVARQIADNTKLLFNISI